MKSNVVRIKKCFANKNRLQIFAQHNPEISGLAFRQQESRNEFIKHFSFFSKAYC